MKQFEAQPQHPEVYEAYAGALTIPSYLGEVTRDAQYSREKTPLNDTDVVIVLPKRVAVGSFGGSLKGVSAPDLGTAVVSDILKSTNRDSIYDEVDSVIFGNVIQVVSGMNPAGQIKTNSGIRKSSPAYTVNFACGSGIESVISAAQEIRDQENSGVQLTIAGGIENMSRLPFYLEGSRDGLGLGDKKLVDSVTNGLTDPFSGQLMGTTAENIAKMYGIGRESVDRVARRSQHLARLAIDADWHKGTIVPIDVEQGRETVAFDHDEYVKGATVTMEGLAKLRPAFVKKGEEGIITAGNSSGINDGAAAMIVTTVRRARELGLEPVLRIVGSAKAGVGPEVMGLGPIPACRKALERANLNVTDMDYVGINEAFSVVPLVCAVELGVASAVLNTQGSAIALGHPVGATGSIMIAEAQDFFNHNPESRWAMVSTCVGTGYGIAAIVEQI